MSFGQGLTLHGYKPLTRTFREGDRVYYYNNAPGDWPADHDERHCRDDTGTIVEAADGCSEVAIAFDHDKGDEYGGVFGHPPEDLRHVPWRFHRG